MITRMKNATQKLDQIKYFSGLIIIISIRPFYYNTATFGYIYLNCLTELCCIKIYQYGFKKQYGPDHRRNQRNRP